MIIELKDYEDFADDVAEHITFSHSPEQKLIMNPVEKSQPYYPAYNEYEIPPGGIEVRFDMSDAAVADIPLMFAAWGGSETAHPVTEERIKITITNTRIESAPGYRVILAAEIDEVEPA